MRTSRADYHNRELTQVQTVSNDSPCGWTQIKMVVSFNGTSTRNMNVTPAQLEKIKQIMICD